MLLRLRKTERQPSSREGKDGHPRLKNRERQSGCRLGMRITHSERMAVETEEQKETRLQRMNTNQSDRLAAETEEQRKARLQRMYITHTERMTVETEEQKEAKLQRMQSDRLAVETEEQREARLHILCTELLTSITTAASVGQLLFYPVFIITICIFPCFVT